MADFTLSKPIFGGTPPKTSTAGNIAYALFVLFCFWAGSQLLNMLVHAPGVYEHLMQVQDNGRPRVEIGFGVSTLFGLVPFLAGCLILASSSLKPHTASPAIVHAFCEPCRSQVTGDFRAFQLNTRQDCPR